MKQTAQQLQTEREQRFHTVCKRVFRADSVYFPKAEYQGKTIYFFNESWMHSLFS